MATIVGAVASSHTPTIGFALDKHKQDDPVWAPIFEAYKPVQAWLAEKTARRAADDLQRSRHVLLLRPLLAVRARHRRVVRRGRRGRRAAGAAAGARARRRSSHHIAAGLVADEFDLVVLPGQGARPRLLLAAVDAVAARTGVAGRDRAAADWRPAVSDPVGAALLQARTEPAAGRSKAIPKT